MTPAAAQANTIRRMLRRLTLATVVCAAVLPASAMAATTYTVDSGAAAGCDAANVCKTILAANAKVADGDIVSIKDGAYNEAGPIVVTKKAVTFKGAPGKVTITQSDGKTDTSVFNLGEATTLDGLVIGVQPNGAHAIVAGEPNAVIKNTTLARTQANTTDAAVVAVSAPTGNTTLAGVVIIQGPTSPGAVAPPAVVGNKTSSLAMVQSSIISTAGPGLVLTGADATVKRNTLVASQILVTAAAADGIVVRNDPDQVIAQELIIDSTIIGSGADGTAIAASSLVSDTQKGAPVVVKGSHVTIAGGQRPVTVISKAQTKPLEAGVAGPVTVELDRSIVHGSAASTSTVETAPILILPLGPTSVATIKITNSDATDTGGARITLADNVNNADAALFADVAKRNYHLRIASPAIDTAGPEVAGESPVDVDGLPRLIGPSTDRGADEFLNLPPIALFTASLKNATPGQTVQFDGSASLDLEAGGGVTTYRWDFGDGTTLETTTPKTEHAYAKTGTYTPTLRVVDPQGQVSALRTGAAITVSEPPKAAITAPANNARLRAFKTTRTKITSGKDKGKTKTTKTRQLFTLKGTSSDPDGIATVAISLRRVALGAAKAPVAPTACIYLEGKTRFVSRRCKTPVYFFVRKDANGNWSYKTKKGAVMRAGTYELTVVAKDKTGALSAPASVTFRVI